MSQQLAARTRGGRLPRMYTHHATLKGGNDTRLQVVCAVCYFDSLAFALLTRVELYVPRFCSRRGCSWDSRLHAGCMCAAKLTVVSALTIILHIDFFRVGGATWEWLERAGMDLQMLAPAGQQALQCTNASPLHEPPQRFADTLSSVTVSTALYQGNGVTPTVLQVSFCLVVGAVAAKQSNALERRFGGQASVAP